MAPGIRPGPGYRDERTMRKVLLTLLIIFFFYRVATPADAQEETSAEEVRDSAPIGAAEGTQIAQPPIAGNPKFEISTRFQSISLDTGSSKATEYRALPEGFYIDNVLFYYGTETQEFGGEAVRVSPLTNLIDDGHGNLNYRRYGLLEAGIDVRKFPHDYGAASSNDVSTQRDAYDLLFRFTPGDRLIISTTLSVEGRKGERPLTMETLTGVISEPTAVTEVKEPVDYTTTTMALGIEYTDDVVDLQLNNSLQIFSNNLRDEVVWDNPYVNSATGKAKVADDYVVQTLSFKPSIKLTDNIRLINSLSYSKVTNSIDLAPFSTAGIGDTFQRPILDSDVRSLAFSSTLSTRPLSDIRLNIQYRYNTSQNDTPKIEEKLSYVMLDGDSSNLIRYPRIPRYMSYDIKSLELDATWSLTSKLTFDSGIENKDTSRTERETRKENEKRLFLSLHSMLSDNLSGRLRYTYARRRGNYDPAYYNTIYDPNPANDVTQHPLMRAFDLSGLDSHTVTASFDYSPVDALTLGTMLSLVTTEHPDVSVGRRHSQGESASLYAQYTPFAGLLLFSEYFHDRREVNGSFAWTFNNTLPYPQDPDPAYSDFTVPVKETVEDTDNVYILGLNYDIDKWLSATTRYSKYDFKGTSINLPEISNTTDLYELSVSYSPHRRFYVSNYPLIHLKDLKIAAGYYLEKYRRTDYALDHFPDTGTDIFLGIREPDYLLHILSVSLSLYF